MDKLQQAKEYIKAQRARGATDDQLKQLFRRTGYTEEDIAACFSENAAVQQPKKKGSRTVMYAIIAVVGLALIAGLYFFIVNNPDEPQEPVFDEPVSAEDEVKEPSFTALNTASYPVEPTYLDDPGYPVPEVDESAIQQLDYAGYETEHSHPSSAIIKLGTYEPTQGAVENTVMWVKLQPLQAGTATECHEWTIKNPDNMLFDNNEQLARKLEGYTLTKIDVEGGNTTIGNTTLEAQQYTMYEHYFCTANNNIVRISYDSNCDEGLCRNLAWDIAFRLGYGQAAQEITDSGSQEPQ